VSWQCRRQTLDQKKSKICCTSRKTTNTSLTVECCKTGLIKSKEYTSATAPLHRWQQWHDAAAAAKSARTSSETDNAYWDSRSGMQSDGSNGESIGGRVFRFPPTQVSNNGMAQHVQKGCTKPYDLYSNMSVAYPHEQRAVWTRTCSGNMLIELVFTECHTEECACESRSKSDVKPISGQVCLIATDLTRRM
jgi:hypothetical protein